MKLSLIRPLLALAMCIGMLVYLLSHLNVSSLPKVTGYAGADSPVTSEERLTQLDETFGSRHQIKTIPKLGQTQGLTTYAYDSVPAPLASVKIWLDESSLAAVEYSFQGYASKEQLAAAFKANGKGWDNSNVGVSLMTTMGEWTSEEGHLLMHLGPNITVYYDGRMQAMRAAEKARIEERKKAPKL